MEIYPQIIIDLKKIKANSKVLLEKTKEAGIKPCAVTKVTCADLEVAKALVESGFEELADSRIENIKKLKEYFKDSIRTLMLRIPMISQASEVVKYCDTSLNSELETIKALDKAAFEQGKRHNIILMIDLGDLREGIWPSDMEKAQKQLEQLENIDVLGLGVNLTCYGGVIPTEEKLGELLELKSKWEQQGKPLAIISGGNSSSINMVLEGKIPRGINHLRLGESLLLGRETIDRGHIASTHLDAFKIVGEIIEIKGKPSMPIGIIGQDAFGNAPKFEDKGTHMRAIVAIGRQDIDLNLEPLNDNIDILGGSSDHLILDVTAVPTLKVGDKIEFIPSYGSLLQAMTSPYVNKVYKHQ